MRTFLNVNQIGQFLENAKDNPRDFALFHLSISTGLRISDVLAIRRSDILEEGAIVRNLRLRMKKTRQWIERPLREDCRQALGDYLASREDSNPYLFPQTHANQYGISKNRPMHR